MNKSLFCNFSKPLPNLPIRVISFFVRNQFLDVQLPQELHWIKRFPLIIVLIQKVNPDILLLQGLNLQQCKDIYNHLSANGYQCYFVASHSGKDFQLCEYTEYTGSFNGICWFNSKFKLIASDGFWLKDEENEPPLIAFDDSCNRKPIEKGGVNKSFGCTHSYRYCVYQRLIHFQTDEKILVATTHFPCGGTDARYKSSELIKRKVSSFSDHNLIFGGSLLLFPDNDGERAYDVLTSFANDYRQSKMHYGHNTSFIGYEQDKHKVELFGDGFTESRNTELILQKGFFCKNSFSLSGEINKSEWNLIEPLNSPIQNSNRYFLSDRFMIGCDLILDQSFSVSFGAQRTLNDDYFFNFTRELSSSLLRVINWNIKTSYHDEIQSKDNPLRKWEFRFDYCKQLLLKLQPDIILLQEMSPIQANQMKKFLLRFGYNFKCRSSHSGHDLDEIQLNEWTGAIMGIAYSQKRFQLDQSGGIWLKKDPFLVPPQIPDSVENRKPVDQGGTDKCFGDTHSYRSCQWVKLKDVVTDKTMLACVSDFPHQSLSGAQIKCAELVISLMNQIPSDCVVFGGEVCTFNDDVGTETLKIFTKSFTHWTKTRSGHFGHQTTFVGYQNDAYNVPISDKGIIQQRNIDILLHKGFREARKSFSFVGEFDFDSRQLIKLNFPVKNQRQRSFASDHLLIGVDLVY